MGSPLLSETFNSVLNVNMCQARFNVLSTIRGSPAMRLTRWEERGSYMASVRALMGRIGQASLFRIQRGCRGMTIAASRVTGAFGIRVMTWHPGLFLTPMLETLSDEYGPPLAASAVSKAALARLQSSRNLVPFRYL